MSEDFCRLFDQCQNLDGKLLIYRTIQGPALAREEGELPFGALTMQGAEVRPYVDLFFQQQWIAKEACYAPIRSVMGLAPGETVTVDIARREQVDYTSLFSNAVDDVTVDSQTSRHGREFVDVDPSSGESPSVGLISAIADAIGLGPLGEIVSGGLSLLPGGGGPGGLPIPGFGGAGDLPGLGANPVTDLVNRLIAVLLGGGQAGAPPAAIQDTLTTVDETLHTIESTQSQHTVREYTSAVSRSLEQRITRTFTNPYRDRSLELRFIPVFRRFEVVTMPHFARAGIAVNSGRLKFPQVGVGRQYGQFLERQLIDSRIVSVANAELGLEDDARAGVRSGAVHDHLEANAEFYTKRFVKEAHREGNFGWLQAPLAIMAARHPVRRAGADAGPRAAEGARFLLGLAWSKVKVQDNSIKVPFAPTETLRYYWSLDERAMDSLAKSLGALAPSAFGAVMPQPHKRNVHLFMGTHIEAVAGQCVLPDLPAAAPH